MFWVLLFFYLFFPCFHLLIYLLAYQQKYIFSTVISNALWKDPFTLCPAFGANVLKEICVIAFEPKGVYQPNLHRNRVQKDSYITASGTNSSCRMFLRKVLRVPFPGAFKGVKATVWTCILLEIRECTQRKLWRK